MDASELLSLLWRATWTSSLAIVAVLALRGTVRRRFGAGIGYALWALVPVTLAALLLPARTRELPLPAVLELPDAAASAPPIIAAAGDGFDFPLGLLALWLAGAVLWALRLWRQQRRFEHGLGALTGIDAQAGVWRAQQTAGLPALVGLWRPRIVLPADIDARYSPLQRELMVLHERLHLRHGDAWVNALAAVLRLLFWFNPLLHVAAARLRHDQELACDARVLRLRPHATAAYADAMLKTQAIHAQVPLGCHWGSPHPLKERIMQLTQNVPGRAWRRTGMLLVAVAALLTGFAAWSAQPERVVANSSSRTVQTTSTAGTNGSRTLHVSETGSKKAEIEVAMQLRIDGDETHQLTLVSADDEPFSVRVGGSAKDMSLEGTVTHATLPNGEPGYRTAFRIRRDGKVIADPSLLVTPGKPAQIKVGDEAQGAGFKGIDLTLTVGPLSAETRAAIVSAHAAAKEAEAAAEQAARDAEHAANAASAAAEQAHRQANQAARQAEVAAAQAARDAEAAMRDADAARAAREAAPARPSAPPPAPAPPVAPSLSMPKITHRTLPVYPLAAMRTGVTGKVTLDVQVGTDGAVRNAAVHSASPPGVFDQSAVDAVKQWRFEVPSSHRRSGYVTRIEIHYSL